ncbi:MAG: hypothetical protein H0W88_07645 [Parachlamydiaceae bacterium]|nr:hypothetical protein [Parachlamydiaceae bacterium]
MNVSNQSLNISIFNIDKSPQIIYSNDINKSQNLAVRENIISIAQKIYSQIPKADQENLEQINFRFDGKDSLVVIIKVGDKEIQVDVKGLGDETKQLAKNLSATVNKLGMTTIKDIGSYVLPQKKELIKETAEVHPIFEKIIRPELALMLERQIKGKSDQQLRQLYMSPETLLMELKKNISEHYSSIDEQELIEFFNQMFIEYVNLSREQSDQPKWNRSDIKGLNAGQWLNRISTGKISLKDALNTYSAIDPSHLNLKQLAAIPLTDENRGDLTTLWKHIFNDLFEKGNLTQLFPSSDISKEVEQYNHAVQFKNAIVLAPPTIFEELSDFLLIHNEQITNIDLFIISQSVHLSSQTNIEIEDLDLRESSIIYKASIVKEYKYSEYVSLDFIKNKVDSETLFPALAKQDQNLQHAVFEIYRNLARSEKTYFDRERIQKLYFLELEKIAMQEYHYTIAQIQNLRECRTTTPIDKDDLDFFTNLKKKYVQDKQEILESITDVEKQKSTVNTLTEKFHSEFIKSKKTLTPEILFVLNKDNYDERLNKMLMLICLDNNFQLAYQKIQIENLEPNAKITPTIKKALRNYIQAKAVCAKLPKSGTQTRLVRFINELEKNIKNTEIQKFIKEATNISSGDPNAILFSKEALEQVKTKNASNSIFSTQEQIDLMVLTKLFNKGNKTPPETRTEEENEQLNLIFERIKTNSQLSKKLSYFDPDKTPEEFQEKLDPFQGLIRRVATYFLPADIDIPMTRRKLPAGISTEVIQFLDIYTSTVKNIDKTNAKLEEIIVKVEKLRNKYQNAPNTITSADKLSLREMGILNDSSRLIKKTFGNKNFMGQLKSFIPSLPDQSLTKMTQNALKSQELYTYLETTLKTNFDAHYTDGSLLAYVGKKKIAWAGKPLILEERMTTYLGGLIHGAKLFNKDGTLTISHVYGKYLQEPVSLYQMCISDVWELDVSKLVNPAMQEKLKEMYGDEWKGVINKRYQEIEKNLHSQGVQKFGNIKNDDEKRLRAGLATFAPIANLGIVQLAGFDRLKGHTKPSEENLKLFHDKFFNDNPLNETQICSEFATKTTLASLLELNRQLSKDVRIYFEINSPEQILYKISTYLEASDIPKDVRDYLTGIRKFDKDAAITKNAEIQLRRILKDVIEYTDEEIDMIIKLGNNEVIDLPYGKQNLDTVHPPLMIKLLENKKCVVKKTPPKAFTSFFNFT